MMHRINPETSTCIHCGETAEWITGSGKPFELLPDGLVFWDVLVYGSGVVDSVYAPTEREALEEAHRIEPGSRVRFSHVDAVTPVVPAAALTTF